MLDHARRATRRARGRLAGRALLSDLTPADRALIDRIRARRLTYLDTPRLASLASRCRRLERDGTPGVLIEAGCALGGSTILLGTVKHPARPLLVHDVFGMIPPPGDHDTPEVHQRYRTIVEGRSSGIGGDRYYGYEDDLHQRVCDNLAAFGLDREDRSIELIPGLVQDTLQVDGPVALAHVDVDWYDPVLTCLTRIFPHLVPGGSIVLDDYHDWGGCRKATDEFLAGLDAPVDLDRATGALVITRR